MYFLDTNTLIYFFKGLGNVASRLFHEPPQNVGIPSIVLFELETGIAKSSSPEKRTAQLRELISVITVIPLGMNEALHSAHTRSMLEKNGTSIGPFDTLIAGTALAHSAVLVTHNTKEFKRIEGLLIEDWF